MDILCIPIMFNFLENILMEGFQNVIGPYFVDLIYKSLALILCCVMMSEFPSF